MNSLKLSTKICVVVLASLICSTPILLLNGYTANSRRAANILRSLEEEKAELSKTINELYDENTSSDNIAIFLYSKEQETRSLFYSNNNLKFSKEKISADVFFSRMLARHKLNHCFLIETSSVQKNSNFYKILDENGNIAEKGYYMSCPLFVKGRLIGYTSIVVNNKEYGYVMNLNELKYWATLFELLIEDKI